MASVQTGIELNDDFSQVIYSMINAVNMAVSGMEQLQRTMNTDVDTSGIEAVHAEINRATMAMDELMNSMRQVTNTDPFPETPTPSTTQPMVDTAQPRAPPDWWHDGLQVFTDTGIERFEQEVQSTDAMITGLTTNLQRTAQVAAGMNMLPPGAAQDIQSVQARLQAVQQRIQQIEANPMNIGVDAANDGLEELRSQLYQAQQAQEALDDALENMDVRGANEAYIQLSQTVSHTEQYIRDNVDEQGRFNAAIQDGTGIAAQLQRTIAGVVGAFAGMAGIRKAWGWIQDTTEAFNIQRNAETQLMTVLGNMVDYAEVPEFIVGIDDTLALSEAGELISTIDGMTVDVTPEMKTDYLLDQFDSITAKASEIQSRGMYGDEAMIAAAGEFATYMSDVEAIGTMMDTLTNYAAGMSGGGEIDTTTMVDYATNLGKIMTGAYDAMTKKGFEFTDAQKAVIDGSATEQQYIEALGEEYVNMSEDMRSATVIADIINESWAGLYETMSDTPQGRIQQMTNAFGDMKEVIGGQLYPYVMLFVDSILANSGVIQSVLDGFTTALQFVMGVLAGLMDVAFQVASVIIDNWSIIEPIIMGVAGALIVYYGAQLAANTVSAISTGIHMAMAAAQMAHAAMTGTLTAATAAQIAAQEGLNAARYASPIVWITGLIAWVKGKKITGTMKKAAASKKTTLTSTDTRAVIQQTKASSGDARVWDVKNADNTERLCILNPVAGFWAANDVIGVAISTVASVIGLTAAKLKKGETVAGLTGTYYGTKACISAFAAYGFRCSEPETSNEASFTMPEDGIVYYGGASAFYNASGNATLEIYLDGTRKDHRNGGENFYWRSTMFNKSFTAKKGQVVKVKATATSGTATMCCIQAVIVY